MSYSQAVNISDSEFSSSEAPGLEYQTTSLIVVVFSLSGQYSYVLLCLYTLI